MPKTPLQKAQIELSGQGLRSRMAAVDRAVAPPRPKAKPKKKQKNLIKPEQKHVDARQAKIDAATAADRAAIVARNRKMSLRSK